MNAAHHCLYETKCMANSNKRAISKQTPILKFNQVGTLNGYACIYIYVISRNKNVRCNKQVQLSLSFMRLYFRERFFIIKRTAHRLQEIKSDVWRFLQDHLVLYSAIYVFNRMQFIKFGITLVEAPKYTRMHKNIYICMWAKGSI